jgi:hypothetical protein
VFAPELTEQERLNLYQYDSLASQWEDAAADLSRHDADACLPS